MTGYEFYAYIGAPLLMLGVCSLAFLLPKK